jgi:hypothetical protein
MEIALGNHSVFLEFVCLILIHVCCCRWTARGLLEAGLYCGAPSSFPKQILVDLCESLNNSKENAVLNNIRIVYYRYV